MTDSLAPSDTLRVGLLSTIGSLDPRHAQDFISALVLAQLYESPYAPPTRDRPAQPRLFRGPLEGDLESRRFAATLRDDVEFWDETPLTAAILADCLGRTPLRDQATIEADGDRVVFRLAEPNARFDQVLTQTYASVTLERGGELVGTGPYLPAEITPQRVRLRRNERYRSPVGIGEIDLRVYPPDADGQPAALVAAFERGEVDFTNMLPREAVSSLQRVRKYFERGNSTALLYMNTQSPALADARARRAVALAIDRLEVAARSHQNALAHVAANILPPLMSDWRDDLRPHPERARALLDELGPDRPRRLKLKLIFGPRPYLPHPTRSAAVIAEQLANVGLEVEVHETKDSKEYYDTLTEKSFDLFLTGWIADTADPTDFLEAILASSMIPRPGEPISVEANLAHWRNERADELLRRLRRSPTDRDRHALLRLAAEEMPVLPLMHGAFSFVHAWRVRNFDPPPLGIPDFSTLELRDLFR
ncbi:MAG: ABC transporter substrate-binding protein [Thermoanaerobaculia bacterium]|nr:ABC transporter substrate-binding protein [Thermoanaerobaculia bacterium]